MRLPRDLCGEELARVLADFGYVVTRRHEALRVGTVAAILGDVGEHLGISREELVERLFAR